MEIAKLRIIRSLWTKVVKAFDPDSEVTPLIVNAFTSKWNKTLYDPHVNVLRTTIEALSAIIGGVDGLCLNAFDYLTDESNAHSTRLAQNIPGIINEESFCDKVIDPAGGSWAIESLSDQLGQKAWSLFQEVEGRGGLSKAIREGFVQNHIETVAKQKLEAIKEGKSVLVGTNQFNNPAEQPQKLLEKTLEPAAPREKTQKQQDALSNVAEQIAACYITDQPNEALFGSTVDAFKTGVTIDDVKLELINGVVDSKMKIICVNQPLKIQRAAQPTEQSRENGQP
jgi:methylmalonyl-CoA mutase